MQKSLYLKKCCFKTKFKTNYMPFIFEVAVYSKDYTNSDYTLKALQHQISSTVMVIKTVIKIFYESVTSSCFWVKKVNGLNFEDSQTAPLVK